MVDSSETIRSLLQAQWPEECEIVDRLTVDRIVTAALDNQSFDDAFRSIHGGADWDAIEVIKFLVQAATFIKTSLEVWKLLLAQLGRKPSKKEFTDAMAKAKAQAPEAVQGKLDSIATTLTKTEL